MATKTIKYKRIFEVMNYMIRAEIAAWGNTLWNQKLQGVGAKDFIILVTNNKIQAYINENDFEKIPPVGFKNFTNPKFVKDDLKRTDKVLNDLRKIINYLQAIDFKKMNNKELGELTKDYFSKVIEVYGHFQTSAPWFFYKIEDKIRNYLSLKIKDYTQRENILRLLARPTKRFAFEEEEINLLKIALQIKAKRKIKKIINKQDPGKIILTLSKSFPELWDDIVLHQKAYEWLNADSNLLSYTLEDVIKKLQELILVKQSEMIKNLKKLINRQKLVINENKKIIKNYKINKTYKKLFGLLQEYAYKRFNIRFCWTQGMYYGQKLYQEIAKRAKINSEEIKYCLVDELINFLIKGKKLDRKYLRARKKQYVIWMINFKLNIYADGKKADRIANYIKKHAIIEKVNEIKGEIGSPGKITGRVKIIFYDKPLLPQIEVMKIGDILVAGQTRPEIIAACRKAGAIVTNEGGICSHAAVVSREFKIPCVIGTKIATDIFKDGDLVEVDANKGIVRKL